eukprot:gene2137-2836_t
MAEGAGAVDKRVAFISSRLCTAFKCEMDKFQALMMKDESRVTIEQFLGDPDVRKFICYEVGKGDLVACTKPPSKFKKKSVYFLKVNAGVELAVDNMDSEVVFGEFSEAPLEFLSASMQEVYLPLLCHHRNQEGWPEVICKEVTDNAHKCIANVYVTVGQTKGKTLLPLPPSEGGADPGGKPNARDKKQIHVLESAVVTWTRQIKNVLKTDPEGALQAGQDPGPLTELEFWTGKAANLHSIYEQLSGPKIRKVIRVLELTKSTYFPSFNRLCKEVAHARVEAQSNVSYLNPLRRYFDRLNMSDEFKELEELFKPIFHMLMLLWSKSKYYNSAARLVVLVREICNDLIQQARTFIDGEEIFKSLEPAEAVSKLQTTLKVCGTFKSYYFDYKAKVGVENPDNPWKFQNSSLFSRLDSFLERCHDIYDLAQIVVQFNKLEKIEVGGTLGKTLTVTVREIFDEFITSFSKFQEITYDITDVENNQFDDDFYQFRTKIKELERQLGAVISQAFDDCTTIAATFKLMDAFEGLLDREIIQADLERKHIDLMRAYGREVITVQNIFTSCKDKPLTPKNSAPRSGAVYWVRGLKTRVEEPMAKLKSLSKMAMETDEAKEIVKNYNALIASLAAYETTTTEIWCGEIESTSDEKLKLPLLVRTPENAIRVNFDPLLLKLLREVKYFLQLGIEVPENSLKIYKRGESFRQQTGNLDLIANIYNEIQNTMLDVERPLVIQKLETIDQHLHQGLNVLNWNSLKIEEYIVEVMSMLKELHEILILIKSNVTKTEKILDRWEQNVMFARKDGRVYTTEEFSDSFKTTLSTRYGDITDGGLEIAKLLSLTNKTLKVSKGAVAWKTYTEFVNEIVIDGFSRAINATLKYVETQIDPDIMAKNETQPLLEISLELVAPEVVWVPDIGLATGGTGIRDMFNGWVKSFVNIGNLVKRLDISEGNYTKEIDEDFEVSWHISRLYGLVLQNEERCAKFKESYDVYSYLWKNDLKESLAQFLDENGKENAEGGKDEPELKIFDDKIAELKNVQTEVQALPSSMVIGWLKVDSKPVKQALGTWLTKWIFLFTQHLSNRVVQSMDDLYQFMGAADQVLDTHSVLVKPEPEEGEEDAPPAEEEIEEDTAEKEEGPDPREVLYNVMGCMRDIRKRQEKTDAMFDPLQQCVLLLKKYGITLNDKTLKALEEAPMTWGGIKKKMLNVREKLSNEQQAEARAIRETSDNFAMKVEDYRKYFQATAPFAVEESTLKPELCDPAYVKLDHFHHGEAGDVYRFGSVTTIMDESKSLNESQELFELFVSDYIALRRCSEELGYLKNLWDQVSSVMFTFSDWYSTPWDKIDTEFLTDETKKLAKDIKTLNKNVRNYEVYKMLEETIKFRLDEKGEPTKYAIGMYSKEKEYVDMDGEVSCDGAVESWLQNVVDGMRDALRLYVPLLIELFGRYMDKSLEHVRRNFKTVCPLPLVNQAQSVCKILEGIIPKEPVRGAPPPDKKLMEYNFVFAVTWALGGAMFVDKVTDYRLQFSKWWVSEWKNVAYPEKGLVFDFYVDEKQIMMVPWSEKAEKTQKKADLADRLVNGLSGENKRWGDAIEQFGIMEGKLVGDVILASAFVSYAGCFNSHFRSILVNEQWMVDLKERELPLTEEKVKVAKVTELNINEAREHYRPVANRGSLVYFLIDNLNVLDRVYQYSMANYVYILKKGMDLTPGGPDESKQIDQIEQPSRDGAFIHGLTLEGCRWDEKAGVLDDSRPKELFVSLPVMLIRAVTADKAELKDAYRTPVYKTERRFREEVFTAQLKSKHGEIKWTLTGACLFLDVVQ